MPFILLYPIDEFNNKTELDLPKMEIKKKEKKETKFNNKNRMEVYYMLK